MQSNHLILCRPLLLLPSIFPRSGESLDTCILASLSSINFFYSRKTSRCCLDSPFLVLGFPGDSDSKKPEGNAGDLGSFSGFQRSPGEGNGNPLQYFSLENSMDIGAWRTTYRGVAKLEMTERLNSLFWSCSLEIIFRQKTVAILGLTSFAPLFSGITVLLLPVIQCLKAVVES